LDEALFELAHFGASEENYENAKNDENQSNENN